MATIIAFVFINNLHHKDNIINEHMFILIGFFLEKSKIISQYYPD